MKSNFFLFSIMLVLFFTACNGGIVYEENKEIPNASFNKGTELNYEFNITDTLSGYDVLLKVEHGQEYGYQNLYVKIKTVFPDAKSIEDIVSLELSKSGTEWQGKCSGDDCTVPIVLVENTKFKTPGKYQISISQYGRTETVEGLNAFTLVVKKVEKK